jgi:hypothetical protein
MIAMQVSQKKALDPRYASFPEKLNGGGLTFDTLAVNDGIVGF